MNLACFHEYSAHKTIVPLVVANAPVASNKARTQFDSFIEKCEFASTDDLGRVLENICQQYVRADESRIDTYRWNQGRFRLIPPIIEAAVALYSGMDEIGHACAAREDLNRTTSVLVRTVQDSRAAARKSICFTTGVPGAGKTLVV